MINPHNFKTAQDLLREAAETIDRRAHERDTEAERSMARAVYAFNALTGQNLDESEGWLFMAVLKMASATVGTPNADDFLDGAAYMALMGESLIDHSQAP